ncbi:MAG: ribonuclease R [Bacteroidetes bacterium]|nr:ribonuclease R [Bacteroidota bacterium]
MSKRKFKAKKEKRSTKSYLFQEILRILKSKPTQSFNYKQIAALLHIENQADKLLINTLLEDFVEKKVVVETQRGKYKIFKDEKLISGKVDMTMSGSAFVIPEDEGADIFVSANNLNSAMHQDLVRIRIVDNHRGKAEGVVEEVIKRARTEFVGTIQKSKTFAFLVPDNVRINTDIFIPPDKLGIAEDKQKAVVKIIEWPTSGKNPIGEVVRILGFAGENDTEMHAILEEFGLPYSFEEVVEKFADSIPKEISESEIAKRRDFRNIDTFTIDPFDAKDFDDALSFKKLTDNTYEIGVHIADVSHYLQEGTILDKEAESRATSVYLVDRTVPMLPEALSNFLCSLRPNEDKLCFSAVFVIDNNAKILEQWFGRTVIHSDKRFSYEDAQEVLESAFNKVKEKKPLLSGLENKYEEELYILDSIAKKLREERIRKGSITFEKQEIKFQLDESGKPTGVYYKQMKDSNKLIEDFMLLANRKVAEFVGKPKFDAKGKHESQKPKPFVYRIHDKPNETKLKAFSEFVSKMGFKLNITNDSVAAQSMNSLLKEVEKKPEANAIELLAIRTMAKAVYSINNIGHYGLGFEHYSHFTSPIRRYPDVLAHRLLDIYLRGEKKNIDENELESKCKHSSEMEKIAADAERASIKYKQVEFLKDKIGEQFEGMISGVSEWGIYVEIIENHCEGMIRLKDIEGDYYYFDEDNFRAVGKKTGKTLRLGDKIMVEIKRADLIKKQIDFLFIEKIIATSTDDSFKAPKTKESAQRIKQYKPKDKKKTDNTHFNDEYGFEI